MDTQRKPFQPEWKITPGLTDYPEALASMEERVQAILEGKSPELVWFLEHPPLYTAGTSAKAADLLAPRFPVFQTGRGGQYTYHGPGQLIAYVMLDLRTREQDIRRYVFNLEEWLIQALRILDVDAVRRDGRVGLWVERSDGRDDKIAAIGVRIRRWITLHGVSLNISPNMSHYAGIVPCGIKEHGITSLERLGKTSDRSEVIHALQKAWSQAF